MSEAIPSLSAGVQSDLVEYHQRIETAPDAPVRPEDFRLLLARSIEAIRDARGLTFHILGDILRLLEEGEIDAARIVTEEFMNRFRDVPKGRPQ